MRKFLLLIIIAGVFYSIKAQTTSLPGSSDTIYCFDPIVNYYRVESNKEVRKDSLINTKNGNCLKEGFKYYFNQITNTKFLDINLKKDSCALKELNVLFIFLDHKSLKEVPRMSCMDIILDSIHTGYALISVSQGFVRSKEDYNKAMRKGVLLSALTLGSYVSIPNESAIDLRIILMNVKTRQLITYKGCKMIECAPDSQKDINTQVMRIFKSTFKKKK